MRLIQRENKGVKEYYTGKAWTRDRLQAKEYRLKWAMLIIEFLLNLLKLIGGTNLKIVKK